MFRNIVSSCEIFAWVCVAKHRFSFAQLWEALSHPTIEAKTQATDLAVLNLEIRHWCSLKLHPEKEEILEVLMNIQEITRAYVLEL